MSELVFDPDEIGRHYGEEPPPDARTRERRAMRSWWEVVGAADADPPRQIVEGLIAEDETALIYGYAGTTKSLFGLELAIAVHRGEPFLGRYATTKARVGIVDEESPLRRLGERLAQLARSHGIEPGDGEMPLFEVAQGHRIDTEPGLEAMWATVRDNDLAVLVIDTMRRVHGLRENDSDDMAKVAEAIATLKRRARSILGHPLTIILIHHAPKPREGSSNAPETMARGSGDIFAAVDCGIYLRKVRVNEGPEGETEEIVIEHAKARWGEPIRPFRARIEGIPGESVTFAYIGEASDELRQSARAEQYVRETLTTAGGQPVYRRVLIEGAQEQGIAQRTLLRSVSKLRKDGTLADYREGRETLYRLTREGLL